MTGVGSRSVSIASGICSAVGAVSWVAACFVHNSLPQGCIDEGCGESQMRGSSPVATTMFAVAGVMLAASGIGLLVMAGQRGRLGRLGSVAGIAGGLGLLLLMTSGVVSTLINSDWNGMPGLVVPGVALLAVGLVLVAIVIIRARVVPTWAAALLLCTALLLPFANEQTSRILLAVPFGVAWLVLGVALLSARLTTTPPHVPRQQRASPTRS